MKIVAPPSRSDDPCTEREALAKPGGAASRKTEGRTVLGKKRGEPRLQHIVEAAARDYDVPIALVSIVDRRREFFAARTGIDLVEAPREDALCLHAIKTPGQATVATDARDDRRFADNPFVTGPPHVRFYAAVPLLDRAGYALGALCIIDPEPRIQAPSLFNLIKLAREAERILDR